MRRGTTRATRTDTLFPYTTLFRADHEGRRSRGDEESARAEPGARRGLSRPPRARLSRRVQPLAGAVAQAAGLAIRRPRAVGGRSEEHTSELQSLMRISYAVFCLIKNTPSSTPRPTTPHHTPS